MCEFLYLVLLDYLPYQTRKPQNYHPVLEHFTEIFYHARTNYAIIFLATGYTYLLQTSIPLIQHIIFLFLVIIRYFCTPSVI